MINCLCVIYITSWKFEQWIHVQGTRNVQGIVLDCVKRRISTPRDRFADEITWENFRRKPSCKSALEYIKERYKKYLRDREEKAKEVTLQLEHFQPMVSLRLLQINYSRLEGQFRYLPPGLKWLQWKQCPLRCMPSSYNPLELAVMDLSESKIETLWGGHSNKVWFLITKSQLTVWDKFSNFYNNYSKSHLNADTCMISLQHNILFTLIMYKLLTFSKKK